MNVGATNTSSSSGSGVENCRHYLIKELDLLLETGSASHYGDLFSTEELSTLETLAVISNSHPQSCLALCKHMAKSKNWYKADTLFTQRQQVKEDEVGDLDLAPSWTDKTSVDSDEVIDHLLSLNFLEELKGTTPFDLAWAAVVDCLLSDELKGV